MDIRKIREEEIIEAKNIAAVCFEWPHSTQGKTTDEYIRDLKENPKDKDTRYFTEKWAAFSDEGEMMSCFSVLPYHTNFDGHDCKMTGIGCVCTYPQHRRKGSVKKCFQAALPDMYRQGFEFSYLFAFSEAFYEKFGYRRSSTSVLWDFDMQGIPDYRFEGSFSMYRGEEDISEYETAYKKYADKMNLMIYRDEFDWDRLKNANPFKIPKYAFLYKNAAGEPCGYVIYQKKKEHGRILFDCSELVFDSFETLKAIMSFIRTYASDYDVARFAAPSCYNLEYFCKDYQQYKSSSSFLTNGMVRVVNVKEVLAKACYQGSGCVTIEVKDEQIPENNKIFEITYMDGRAKNIQEQNAGAIVPDVEMTVSVFSGAIAGNYNADDFDFMEGINIHSDKEKLKGIFYKKPCWICNYF